MNASTREELIAAAAALRDRSIAACHERYAVAVEVISSLAEEQPSEAKPRRHTGSKGLVGQVRMFAATRPEGFTWADCRGVVPGISTGSLGGTIHNLVLGGELRREKIGSNQNRYYPTSNLKLPAMNGEALAVA